VEYRRFESFCNTFQNGYVKPWKSFSIFHTIENENPSIKSNKKDLTKYLENCLLMEGFLKRDIEVIATYIQLDGNV
jgi:hypothetical protein